MRKALSTAFAAAVLFAVILVPAPAAAGPIWYKVSFTGVDVWTYSADNAAESRLDQDAPRRYRDWTQVDPLQATTYGLAGGLPTTGFNAWAPGSGFAFDLINLWGAGGAAAAAWGESYVSVGNSDPGAEGVSSWQILRSPTGWTSGIVKGNDPWSADATHAFPVWRSGTGAPLSLANMNDPDFLFEFMVLADPAVFDANGRLRVFFGGFSDDLQMAGPDNYEVSGVMGLRAVPEPATLSLLGIGAVVGAARLRRRRQLRP